VLEKNVVSGVAGILLTGGSSRRMGFDKTSITIDGERLPTRIARLLSGIVQPVVEVGPGLSGLRSVREDRVGEGPLGALAVGYRTLRDESRPGSVLVLACDMPLIDSAVIGFLARWPGTCSVVPVVDGRAQPLCARWSKEELDAVEPMVESGERSMRALLAREGVVFADEASWSAQIRAEAFADADSPEDLDRLGLAWSVADPDARRM
jgi:molybdopterin-guanine dinucleotide biosynthesis protein A